MKRLAPQPNAMDAAKRPRMATTASGIGDVNWYKGSNLVLTPPPSGDQRYTSPTSGFSSPPWWEEADVRAGSVSLREYCGAVCIMWLHPWKSCEIASTFSETIGCQSRPTVFFMTYVARVLSEASLSASVVDVALLLVWRFRTTNPSRPVRGLPSSEVRIVVAALMVANKFLDDVSYTARTWARLTHFPVAEIVRMEREFLDGIKFKLSVSPAEWAGWRVRSSKIYSVVRHLDSYLPL